MTSTEDHVYPEEERKRSQERVLSLSALKDSLAESCFGLSLSEALEEGVCVDCGKDPKEQCYSPEGMIEWRRSGLCEICFDRIMASGEEEEE